MSKIVLKAQPLTKEAYAPFGDVIESEGAEHFSINLNTVERYNDLANIDIDFATGGRAIVSLAETISGTTLPFELKLIERHPRASQAFIPMFDVPVYVVVGPPTEEPPLSELQAFVTNGRQGFNYNVGVWHMPLMADEVGRRFVVVDRGGPGHNCDEHMIEEHTIELIA